MKRVLIVLLALALLAPSVSAEISDAFWIGAWGRGLWDVVGHESNYSDGLVAGIHQSWGEQGTPRLNSSMRINSDNVTILFDWFINGEDLGIGDFGGIDIRPFAGTNVPLDAAVFIGRGLWGETRVDTSFGMWDWHRIGSVNGDIISMEGMLFGDILGVYGGVGLRLYPIEGLTIGWATYLGFNEWYMDVDAEVRYGNSSAYVGYRIPNIGMVRLGYDSRYPNREPYSGSTGTTLGGETWDPWGIVHACFEFTMVDGLYAAIGAKVPTSFDQSDAGTTGDNLKLILYANYDFRRAFNLPINVYALFNTKIMALDATTGENDGFGFQAAISAKYEVIQNVPVWFDLRYANGVYMEGESAAFGENDCWTFGVGVSRLMANAELGIAFEMATNGYGGPGGEMHWGSKGQLMWAIPIKWQVAF